MHGQHTLSSDQKNRGDSFCLCSQHVKSWLVRRFILAEEHDYICQRTMNKFVLLNLLSVSICWFCFKYPWYWSTSKTQFSQNYNDKDLDKLCILIMFPMSYNLMMSAILKTFRNVSCFKKNKFSPEEDLNKSV